MKRNYKLFIDDIRQSIKYIEEYTQKVSEEEFLKNVQLQDSVIRRLEIIGVASKNIPRAVKEINKGVPWQKLSSFRDFISPSYFESSLTRVWRIVKEDLPKIKEQMKVIKLK